MKIALKTIIFFIAGAFLLAGCSEYDDSALTGRMDDLENRVSELEKLVADLNTNVQSVSATVRALENEDRIESIEPLEDGTGYKIIFTKTGEMIIKNGEKPSIGIQQDELDGIWYWTVDGEYLLDDTDNRIPATMAPEFMTQDGQLYYRVNGGEWQKVNGADQGIGLISRIEQTDEDVIFYLSTGGEIVIPKVQGFSIQIEFSEIGASAGSTVNIPYSIIEGDDETVVKAIPDAGYTVTVSGSSNGGILSITLPSDDFDKGSVVVLAINGKGTVSGKLLTFADGQLNITNVDKTAKIGKEGGVVTLNLETNLPYMIVPRPEINWVRQIDSPVTKALRQDVIYFEVDANDAADAAERQVSFTIQYGYSYENSTTFTIVQTVGGSADFNTFSISSTSALQYTDKTSVTDAGWHINEYCIIYEGWQNFDGIVPILCGLTDSAGELYSPELEGGCGQLTINYGSNAAPSQNVGFGFRVTVSNEVDTPVTFDIVKDASEVERYKVYTETRDINLSGTFTVTVTNLCTSPHDIILQKFKDAVGITAIEWSGYSE